MNRMTTDISPQDTAVPAAGAVVPEKPSLDGIEEKWVARWAAEDAYAFDRDAALQAPRAQSWSIDTPPPTASGTRPVGHAVSSTRADFAASYQRLRGRHVTPLMGLLDDGLPTER